MSLDLTDDKSTSVQVMAWCRQATSHYMSQCWPRSLLPYGVTRPQWVNKATLKDMGKYTMWIYKNWSHHHNKTKHSHTMCIHCGTNCYNPVSFIQNSHNRRPIARPSGRGMGCLFWVRSLIYVLLPSSQHRMYGVPVLSSKSDLRSVAVIAAPYVWGACFEFEVWFMFCCRHRSTVCMGCLFWVRSLIYVLLPSSQHRMYGVPVLSSKSDFTFCCCHRSTVCMGCLFWVRSLIYVLLLSSQHRMYGVPVLSSKSDLR